MRRGPRQAKSGRQCETRGDVPRVTYPCQKEDEPPEVTRKRLESDDQGRLVWREHLVTLERLEAFVCRFPVLSSLSDMRIMTQTLKLIEGIGFKKGTPSTLSEVVFARQQAGTPPSVMCYELEDFVERSIETGEEHALKRMRFDLSIDYYMLWKLALQYDIDLKAQNIPNSSGWWGHAVRLILRYQWWVFFGTDNWTQRTAKNEYLHQVYDSLPENNRFKTMLYFGSIDNLSGRFDKMQNAINSALKHQGLSPRKHPFDLSRLVAAPAREEEERLAEREQVEKAAKRQRTLEAKKANRTDAAYHKLAVRKNITDGLSVGKAKPQEHNTMYSFVVEAKPPKLEITLQMQKTIAGGWLEHFDRKFVNKSGVTKKSEPTQREIDCNKKFGVTHHLDRYVELREDIVKEDVEKLLFRNLEKEGFQKVDWIGLVELSQEHYYHNIEGETQEELKKDNERIKELYRQVFRDTVAPYVKQQPSLSVDMDSASEGSA